MDGVLVEGQSAPCAPARGSGEHSKLPPTGVNGTALEEVDFDVFLSFRNHQFLSTRHSSPVIVLLSLDVTVVGQVGLKSQQGKPKPEQIVLSPSSHPSLQPLLNTLQLYYVVFEMFGFSFAL